MDYTAQGHTVGLAQRMERLADPGKAYLSERTAKLVEGLFRLGDITSGCGLRSVTIHSG
jgi:class 3 adenylate cyclase